MLHDRILPLGLVLLAAVLMLPGLSAFDFWGSDEARYAQASREILDSGDWLHLTVNGRPYAKKPPLLMWLQAATASVTGDLTELEARLPGALAGVATVLLVYLLGLTLFDRRAALLAALFLAVTPVFVKEARTARMDVLLTFFVCLSFLGFVRWERGEGSKPAAALLFLLPLPLGVMTKWVGPLFVLPPAVLYLLLSSQARRLPLLGAAAAVILSLAPLFLWIDLAEYGRILTGSAHPHPWHYLLLRYPLVALPFAALLPGAVRYARRRVLPSSERRGLLLLAVWIAFGLLMLSANGSKRSNYLDPLLPPTALLAGWFAARLLSEAPVRAAERWLRAPLAAVAAAVLVAGVLAAFRPEVGSRLRPLAAAGAVVGGGWLAASLLARPRALIGAFAGALAAGCLVTFLVVLPSLNERRSVAPFLSVLRERAGPDARVAYLGTARGARRPGPRLVFYARRRIETVRGREAALRFLAGKGERFLLVRRPGFELLAGGEGRRPPPGIGIEAENRWPENELVLLSNREGAATPVILGP